MVSGYWLNQDGLNLQYGTSKAVPEVGGDYLMYGENRVIETYISLATTQIGGGTGASVGGFVQIPALPSSFSGTTNAIAAGIQSLTTFVPLQQTAVVNSASSGNGLILLNPQIWWDRIVLECLVTANAGTGGATGLTGIGLVYATEAGASSAFAQVAPNAGVQIMGAQTNANMTAGKQWVELSDGTFQGAGSTNPPTAGSWFGNIPITTSFLNGTSGALAQSAWISTIAAGGTYSGTTAAGLLKLRIYYNIYGGINQ